MDRKIWRKVSLVACALAVTLASAASASAAHTPYEEGNISTTYLDIYRDILSKIPITKDYVVFRFTQYEYRMYVGDFEWDGVTIEAVDDVVDKYSITATSTYNSTYLFNATQETGVEIDPGDMIVYSNLGPFPGLREPVDLWGWILASLLMVMILGVLIWRIFGGWLRA